MLRIIGILMLTMLAALNASGATAQSPGEAIVAVGYVFNDANGNLRRDRNERGLPNMTVVSQPADADASLVEAVAITDKTGRFEITTRVGNRLSVVASSGYKPVRANGQIVETQTGEFAFPMYLDKVVINNRVIQAPQAEVKVSPVITVNVASPEVNVAPPDVNVAPAEISVLPAPVRVTQAIPLVGLLGAAGLLGCLSLISAIVIGVSMHNNGRVMRQIANWQASREAESERVTDGNWRRIVQQLVADSLDQIVQIEALIAISEQPMPHMRFRATNAHVYGFSLGRRALQRSARPRCIDWMAHPSAPGELRALWLYFAGKMGIPEMLPRRDGWYVSDVSPHLSPLRRLMHDLELARLRLIAEVRSRIERVTSRRSEAYGDAVNTMTAHSTTTESASAPIAQVEQDVAYHSDSLSLPNEEDANTDEMAHQAGGNDTQPIAELEAEPNAEGSR